MALAILTIFIICMSLSFVEERMKRRDVLLVVLLIGIVMIIIAGTRGPEDTPDSHEYEEAFNSINSLDSSILMEPSFIYISYFLNTLGLGLNTLFFIYAFLSIPIRLGAIWKMSKLPLLTLSIYISFYYQLHDLIQIRCAVASALFLYAVYYYAEGERLIAILFILLGTIFHYSALAGFAIFLFSNKELNIWWQCILYLVIPIGFIFYFSGLDITSLIPEQFMGDRFIKYRTLKEWGEGIFEGVAAHKNYMILINIVLYYGSLYFHKVLTQNYKYVPILLKILALAFICRLTLDNISSVLASRLFEYFDIVSIFLWAAIIYAFIPVYIGKIATNIISTARILFSIFIYTLHL